MAAMALTTFFAACDKDNDGNLYNVSVTASEGGTVAGDNGKHSYGEELTFVAIPNTGYSFSCWSDGVKTNPRTIIVNSDVALVALFANNNGNSNNSVSIKDIIIDGVCWDGRSFLGSENSMSNFYFIVEKDSGLGFEEIFVGDMKLIIEEFSWYWFDNSHQTICLNYEGVSLSTVYYIEIIDAQSDIIKGWLYQSLDDYEYDKNNGNNNSWRGTRIELKRNDDYDRELLQQLLEEWRTYGYIHKK